MKKPLLVLFDGNALVHRAYHALPPLTVSKASEIIGEPELKGVAEIFQESGKVWSGIATGALPDSCPTLKRTRELLVEKNRVFEEQPPDSLTLMKKTNDELEFLQTRVDDEASEDLQKVPEFLVDVKQSILRCYETEKKAFQKLSSIIK